MRNSPWIAAAEDASVGNVVGGASSDGAEALLGRGTLEGLSVIIQKRG